MTTDDIQALVKAFDRMTHPIVTELRKAQMALAEFAVAIGRVPLGDFKLPPLVKRRKLFGSGGNSSNDKSRCDA